MTTNGNSGEIVKTKIYTDTGYRVDHVPFLPSYVDNLTPAVVNDGMLLYDHCGIGTVRVSIPADFLQYVDYAVIERTSRLVMTQPDNPKNVVIPPAVVTAYYFVTGYRALNGSVAELSIMLDAWTTCRKIGADFTSAGGRLVRCPVLDSEEYNVLAEPYVPQYPYIHSVKAFELETSFKYGYKAGANDDVLMEDKDGPDTIILSPYNLRSDGAFTSENVSVSGDQGTTNTITYATAKAVEQPTNFFMGKYNSNYKGIRAYELGYGQKRTAIMERISSLFAAGISNAVMDAYVLPGGFSFVDAAPNLVSAITGDQKTVEYTLTGAAYDPAKKSTFMNRYITLFSPSSGESQTYPLTDLQIDDGKVYVDTWCDPMPGGGYYFRLRLKGEDAPGISGTTVQPDTPGTVKSKEWRKATLAVTQNGFGIEQGATWKNAELGISAVTARAEAAATSAQYDMNIGNGYLLNNAGNQYGLQQVRQSNVYAQQQYNTMMRQADEKLATSAAGAFAGMTGDPDDPTSILPLTGATAQAGGAILSYGHGIENAANSLANTAAQNAISAQRMMDEGQYNIQNLSAQSNAATALANAQQDKIALETARLNRCADIPIMGYERAGMLQTRPQTFYIIETQMDPRDVDGFRQSLEIFGESVYLPPADVLSHLNSTAASGHWNFVQITGMGAQFLTGLSVNIPAWLRQGFVDQLAGGLWIYKE